jgi:hypothetical protein
MISNVVDIRNIHVMEVEDSLSLPSSNDNKHTIFFNTCLWSLFIGSIVILYTAYHTPGTQTIVTGISAAMICIEMLIIAYQHPLHYEWVRSYMEIALRINICQLIVASSFIYYINYVDFSTYFTLLCVFTLPILVLSVTPILRDV